MTDTAPTGGELAGRGGNGRQFKQATPLSRTLVALGAISRDAALLARAYVLGGAALARVEHREAGECTILLSCLSRLVECCVYCFRECLQAAISLDL